MAQRNKTAAKASPKATAVKKEATPKVEQEITTTEVEAEDEEVKQKPVFKTATVAAKVKRALGDNPTWSEIKNNWVYKDRLYELKNETQLTRIVKSKNFAWFDEEEGFERQVAYTKNQKTPFVDEFKGEARLDRIIFRNGFLFVPKEKPVLQQILSYLHPENGKVYIERDDEKNAMDELDMFELEIEALNLAKQMDIDAAEAVVRTKVGSRASSMTTAEIRKDLILLAKENPALFIEIANDDDIEIRNDAIRGVEEGIIQLVNRNTLFVWGSTQNKLCKVGFDEEPYQTITRYFKTDEGSNVYKSLKKQLEHK